MNCTIREYTAADAHAAAAIWNHVVEEGVAFPQDETMTESEADCFFCSQTYTGIAEAEGEVVGLYILHPNNVGRCGHICNASYAVRDDLRGLHIGEALVQHCITMAHEKGFRILQFNAVAADNVHALHLYQRLGFTPLGVIPEGFRRDDGSWQDIIPHWRKV